MKKLIELPWKLGTWVDPNEVIGFGIINRRDRDHPIEIRVFLRHIGTADGLGAVCEDEKEAFSLTAEAAELINNKDPYRES